MAALVIVAVGIIAFFVGHLRGQHVKTRVILKALYAEMKRSGDDADALRTALIFTIVQFERATGEKITD